MAKTIGRTSELRERAYGGKAGIWLKKRKRRVAPHLSSTKEATVTPVEYDKAYLNPFESEDHLSENLGNLTVRTVAGWDDVRCRPIYTDCHRSIPKDEKADNTPHGGLGASTNEESDDDEYCFPMVASLIEDANDDDVSKKPRAYGSRKRRSGNLPDATGPKRTHLSKPVHNGLASSTTITTPSLNRTSHDLVTPQSVLGSICAALNSDTKAKPIQDRSISSSVLHVENKSVASDSRKANGFAFRRRKKHIVTRTAMPLLAELDFVDEGVGQPSSSLEQAKAFFERLDAQQKLNLDASDSPGKACVRTERAVKIESSSLREEYGQYVAATNKSGVVDPVSVEQYAMNRSTFFRRGEMYDGFLDE